jgi:hypothetical protein
MFQHLKLSGNSINHLLQHYKILKFVYWVYWFFSYDSQNSHYFCTQGNWLVFTMDKGWAILVPFLVSPVIRPDYRCRVFLLHLITLKTHTHTRSWTPLTSDQHSAEAAIYTAQNKHKRQIYMPSAWFEPAVPASKRPQTYDLDALSPGSALCCDLKI